MSGYSVLEPTLKEILDVIKPLREDWVVRLKIIEALQDVVASMESLRGATVEPFGSFVSNLFSRWGDLDISIMLSNGSYISSVGKKHKQNLLGDVLRVMRQKGGWRRLQFIPNAKVPILKFESGSQSISCDISIDNLQGQMKSKFLFWINEIDGRFRDLVLLVKEWAKTHKINDPKSGTLNSYSLSLLVIFHFQTCVPPILPPLKDIYPGNVVDDLIGVRADVERRIGEICAANIAKYRSNKSRAVNRSSLSELFISFLVKFCDIDLKAANLGICPFTGQWEEIRSNTRWLPRTYALFIEDPFEQPENTARTVSAGQLTKISGVFQTSHIRLFSGNQNRASVLGTLVRAEISHFIGGATPVREPGYTSGYQFTTRPQTSRNVYIPSQGQHRTQNTRLEDHARNPAPQRKENHQNGLTRQKKVSQVNSFIKQRQETYTDNSTKLRPGQPYRSPSQAIWRPKSDK